MSAPGRARSSPNCRAVQSSATAVACLDPTLGPDAELGVTPVDRGIDRAGTAEIGVAAEAVALPERGQAAAVERTGAARILFQGRVVGVDGAVVVAALQVREPEAVQYVGII